MKWLLWLYTAIKMTTFQSKWESIVSYTDYGHKMSRFHILSDKIITQTQNSIKMSEKLSFLEMPKQKLGRHSDKMGIKCVLQVVPEILTPNIPHFFHPISAISQNINQYKLKVSKFRKQIFQPKLLPKNEPTIYPDYLSGQKNKFDGSVFGRSFGWKISF